jgi:hypothetical protein
MSISPSGGKPDETATARYHGITAILARLSPRQHPRGPAARARMGGEEEEEKKFAVA